MSSWSTSNRRDRLPSDWSKTRRRILKRDRHECQHRDRDDLLCGRPATEVDHVKAGDDHRDSNLSSICTWHHARKSSKEGNEANAQRRQEIDSRFRVTEAHPGLL